MTVHNESSYLRTAVDSMLAQTYSDFHFLIVDDASTDDSREIVNSYQDERIQLVALEKNVGQTKALNIGITYVETDWIARMDADDYSAPQRLEEQMKAIEADYPRLVACRDAVAEIEGVARYLDSERRIAFNEDGIFRHYPELDPA